MRTAFRITLGTVILIAVAAGLLHLAWTYIQGIRFQMSGFSTDFGDLVNRNLLAPWRPDQEGFLIRTGMWCPPGTEPGWPKTRRQCAFVGGGIRGCSVLTYGRSCAVIGVPETYFRDPHFRESLRVALSNLCAAFPVAAPTEPTRRRLPDIYHILGCSGGRSVSLSVHIEVKDFWVAPPYKIRTDISSQITAIAHFSARTKEITMVSGPNK
jgi:hypothetical protein